ncbi:MAG TPA: DUF4870 domain-containing protein [Candidatus Acidoferrum sp.]|nr:DUF4870 domain-containing protein [Candidatus Acidoferrum sp.]
MPHCTKCGAAVAENAAFCTSCGTPQASGAPAGPPTTAASAAPAAVAPAQTGIEENVAGLLSYLLGWLTGLVFFLIDKRPNVQFHARQSIVVFGGLTIIHIFVMPVWGISTLAGWGIFGMIAFLIDIVGFVLWIVCMIKAYQGQRFRVPLAADLSDKIFGKV